MERKKLTTIKSNWHSIFLQSPANGADYAEPEPVLTVWSWPNSTWMKKRLAELANAKEGE